jgi:hypothetical protein
MSSMRLASAALLLALLLPAPARARPWQGIEPGKSTAEDVLNKFGEPTTRKQRGPKSVIAYKGEHALPGTKEAQFACRADGVVEEITVFLSVSLDMETVEGTFGKPQTKTFVEATFQKVWLYPQKGVTVFFDKASNAEVISYGIPAPGRAAPPVAAERAEKAAAPEKAP